MKNQIINKIIRRKKIAFLHVGRCGSTVVSRMLRQNNEFHNSEEIFLSYHEKGMNFSQKDIEELITKNENQKISKFFAFETKFSSFDSWGGGDLSKNCLNIEINEYLQILKKLNYKYVIILERKNHLKRILSILMGRKTGVWHSANSIENSSAISIDVKLRDNENNEFFDLIEYMNNIDKDINNLRKNVSDLEVLNLNYEEHIEKNPKIAYEMVCNFIGIKNPVKPNINFKKTNTDLLKNKLSNYNELKSYLSSSKYLWMLEE